MKEAMRIDIWSDYVCPFCTIGERHLALALEQFEGRDEVEIVWRSFELSPDAPKNPQGLMVDELVRLKGGTKASSETNLEGLAARAKNAGLNFNWQEAVLANTRDAHRVGKLAQENGVGPAWGAALKTGFFSEGKNVADHDVLRQVGTSIGLQREDIHRVLASEEFDEEVQDDINLAGRIGIQGVPFFVLDNHLAVSGAQPVEMFVQALHQAAEGK